MTTPTKTAEGVAALEALGELKTQAEGLVPSAKKLPTHVCVIRKNWGQQGIAKLDSMDGIDFIDGVARDVPRDLAEKWEAHPKIGVRILPNNADEGDFIKATGVQLMPIENFVAMVKGYDSDKLAEFLGPEAAQKLATALARHGVAKG